MFAMNKYLIAAAVALSMAGWGYGQYKYSQGRKAAETAHKLELAKINEQARNEELALQAKITELDKKHYEEFKIAQTTINQLRADVAAGRKRLSVKIKPPVCQKEDASTASLGDGTARAELDGQDAEDLIGIVIEGDQAIRQLNALQDYVEEIVESSRQ